MICPTCYKSAFRLSRFHTTDMPALLTFRYPVRCRTCDHRLYANLFFAFQLWQARRRKRQLLAKGAGTR